MGFFNSVNFFIFSAKCWSFCYSTGSAEKDLNKFMVKKGMGILASYKV